jgi:peptidoglycan/LPS O-acetylase OafA/YrhL
MTFSKGKMMPLKALMAILIVADHLTFFSDSSWLKPFREMGAPIVSVFLFISGYGLSKSFEEKGKMYLESFFKKRFLKVLLPLLVALACYWVLLAIPGRSFLHELAVMLQTGKPILPFSWFAPVILFFYLVFYLTCRFFQPKCKNLCLTVSAFLLIILTIWAGYDRCWWICSLSFPAGAIFADYEKRVYAYCDRGLLQFLVALVIPSILFIAIYLTGNPYLWTLCYVCIPVIVALLLARFPLERLSGRVIAFLSMISYEIYLCQGIPMELFRGKWWIASDIVFVFVVYAATILTAYLVHMVSMVIHRRICASSTT